MRLQKLKHSLKILRFQYSFSIVELIEKQVKRNTSLDLILILRKNLILKGLKKFAVTKVFVMVQSFQYVVREHDPILELKGGPWALRKNDPQKETIHEA